METTPPRTPTARKSLPGSASAVTPITTTLSSPIVIQKRKWQDDNVSLPLPGLKKTDNMGESSSVAQMMSKWQKTGDEIKPEVKLEHEHLTKPVSPLWNQNFVQSTADSRLIPPQFQHSYQPNTAKGFYQEIFMFALRSNRSLIPADPAFKSVGSQHIDSIVHAMWQVAFDNGDMPDITAKAAMFSRIKLRALARLNYLPSWWFLRTIACDLMKRQGWNLDDREMQGLWEETVLWCGRVEAKVGVQDGGHAGPKRNGGDGA